MATAKSLLGCLGSTTGKVPKDIAVLANEGKKQAMILAVETHLKKLNKSKVDLGKQRDSIISAGEKSSTAGQYTNRTDDPQNELGTFTTKSIGSLLKNIIQRVGSVSSALKSKLLSENKITSKERKVIEHFNQSFNPKMSQHIEDIYKQVRTLLNDEGTAKIDSRHLDMMQYLPRYERYAIKEAVVFEDEVKKEAIYGYRLLPTTLKDADGNIIMETKLDTPTKEAITATAYEWLHTDGSVALNQNDGSLRSLLGIQKEAAIPSSAQHHLKDVGVKSDALALQLGRIAFQRLSITPTGEADALAKNRMELSLGFMAIAAMEQMEYLKRQEVFTGELSKLKPTSTKKESQLPKGPFGFAALKEGVDIDDKKAVFFEVDPNDSTKDIHGRTREGTPTMTFLKLVSIDANGRGYLTTPKHMREGETLMKDSGREAFNKLFANESDVREFSWKKILLPKVMRVGRSDELVSAVQRANIQNYTDIPYKQSMWTMGAFLAFDHKSDAAKRIMGVISTEGKLNLRKDSIEGTNRGIDRNLEAVLDMVNQASEEGVNPEFYLPSNFQNNMRMGQHGSISLQGSKMDRNLFAQAGWTVSFKSTPAQQSKMDKAFLQAIAFAFDIETGKVGGVKKQTIAFKEMLSNPAMASAINAMREYNKTNNMTTELADRIATGVELTGTKLHGFKGIVEYSRYLDHREATPNKDFTTDIYAEEDGVSNGIIIGTLQLMPDGPNKQHTVAMLAMGGMSVKPLNSEGKSTVNLDEELGKKNLNDAYVRLGQVLAEEVAKIKKKLKREGAKSIVTFNKAEALGRILGKFQDKDGVVNALVRSYVKPMGMLTVYGSSIKTQINNFTGTSVIDDGVYKEMEAIINDVSKGVANKIVEARLKALLDNVTVLTNRRDSVSNYQINDSLNIELLQKYELTSVEISDVNSAVNDTYGKAMKVALDTVYADVIEARKPFSTAIQFNASIYNIVLQKKVDAKLEAKRAATPKAKLLKRDVYLTKDEMTEILDDIKHLLPKIKTPWHVEGTGPSYLPMASVGKNKNYAASAKVNQSYAKGGPVINKGHAEGIPLLDKVGSSAIVRAIQMIDSSPANHLMSLPQNILNNHDGFSHGIADGDVVRHEVNTKFYEDASEYSLGKEISDMHTGLTEGIQEALTETGASPKEIIDQLIDDGVITLEMITQDDGRVKELKEYVDYMSKKKNISYFDALAQVIKADVESQGAYDDSLVDHIFDTVTDAVIDMGEQTTRNKKVFTDAVTHSGQYPRNGRGVDVIPKTTEPTIFGDVDVDKVTSIDSENTDKHIETMAELVSEGFQSSQENVSTEVNDYPSPEQIDSKNVTEVFEAIVDEDIQAGESSTQDSVEHVSFLKEFLDNVVAKVMTPVELFKEQHNLNDKETMGLWQNVEGKANKIWIQTQRLSNHPRPGMLGQGIRMSAAETYVHEISHHITRYGMKNDSFLANQAYDLYELARKAFIKQYSDEAYRVFMNDPTADLTATDPNSVAERAAALDRWNYVFNAKQNPDGSHNGVDEFLAFGRTNENFRTELSYLTLDDKTLKAKKSLNGIFEKNLQTTIVNLYKRIMDVISQAFYKQQHSTRVDLELDNLVLSLSEVEGRGKTGLYNAGVNKENKLTALSLSADEKIKSTINNKLRSSNSKAAIKIERMGVIIKDMETKGLDRSQWPVDITTEFDKLEKESQELLDQDDSKIVQKISHIINFTKQLPERDNMISHQMRLALNWYSDKDNGLLAAIGTEMKGTTERMKPLHQLLSRRKYVIDAASNDAAKNIKATVNTWFKRKLNTHEKASITKAFLKTDIASLKGKSTLRATIGYLEDGSQRESHITSLLNEIKADSDMAKYAVIFENAADDLGYYMITGSSREGDVPMMNAHNIALMHGTVNADVLQGASFDKAVGLIDQLATMTSLRYVNNSHKRTAASLIRENLSSVESVLLHHSLLKEEAFVNAFNSDPSLMQKGYTKNILNSRIKYEQGTFADKKRFEDMGYVMQNTPIRRDPADPVQTPIYMFKATIGTVNDMQAGIMSLQGNIAKGTDEYTLQQQIGNTYNPSAQADVNNAKVVSAVMKKLDDLGKVRIPWDQRPRPTDNYMIPKFDTNSNIVTMRYIMTEQTKDAVLEQHSAFDDVLASMSSQVVTKEFTPKINSELVSALKDLFDHPEYGFLAIPDAFIEISPHSKNKRHRDIYNMIPPKAKLQIESLFGGVMMVPRDVIDLAFGQRKYSIVEMFGKDAKTRNLFESNMVMVLNFALGISNPFIHTDEQSGSAQGRAVNRVKKTEDIMTQLTKLVKSNIIIRNLSVTRGNYASNMAYLKSKGIPLERISTLSRQAIVSALEYKKDNTQLQIIKKQRTVISRKTSLSQSDRDRLTGNLDLKIKRLENTLANNPSTAMIHAGLMPSIVDDVDTGHVQSPYKYGVDALLESGLNKLPGKAEKVARTLFMTEDTEGYTMLNNAVKMTDYVGRYVLYKHYTAKGMKHLDAISAVKDEFINFELPTHKMIEYLNSVGIVWFSKYGLRVLKHIKNLVKDQPFTTLVTFILGSVIGGNNILQSIPGITKDLLQGWGDPFSALGSSVDQILYLSLADSVTDL